MKRRFAVIVDDATRQQQDAITALFKNLPSVGYWHWFSDLWLLTDPESCHTSSEIRILVNETINRSDILVLQIDAGEHWAAHWSKNMGDWMRNTWRGD